MSIDYTWEERSGSYRKIVFWGNFCLDAVPQWLLWIQG